MCYENKCNYNKLTVNKCDTKIHIADRYVRLVRWCPI